LDAILEISGSILFKGSFRTFAWKETKTLRQMVAGRRPEIRRRHVQRQRSCLF